MANSGEYQILGKKAEGAKVFRLAATTPLQGGGGASLSLILALGYSFTALYHNTFFS